VHTAHAEAEGRAYRPYFEELLDRGRAEGWRFVTLGDLLEAHRDRLPACRLERGFVEGRAGAVSIQGEAIQGETIDGMGIEE
jgi:undecaprenyl phosphate-alpha-L-ara4FN deformylase